MFIEGFALMVGIFFGCLGVWKLCDIADHTKRTAVAVEKLVALAQERRPR